MEQNLSSEANNRSAT